jgi:hypothetical protein
MEALHKKNAARLREIVAEHGWPAIKHQKSEMVRVAHPSWFC